eukprot:CAMPEP_0119296524 /NCGR_PEP_ID=MMETSP1329-20130426/50617_1 /TAXON_ID=114041 /ORGANISM="Genus nov. species nov., Strain RCC1024" /LENGTH=333 /DNA_ID=CAMNT_0007297459 /DNA_START=157 /DNA_END=1155 /DNA_ORIENTATION=-
MPAAADAAPPTAESLAAELADFKLCLRQAQQPALKKLLAGQVRATTAQELALLTGEPPVDAPVPPPALSSTVEGVGLELAEAKRLLAAAKAPNVKKRLAAFCRRAAKRELDLLNGAEAEEAEEEAPRPKPAPVRAAPEQPKAKPAKAPAPAKPPKAPAPAKKAPPAKRKPAGSTKAGSSFKAGFLGGSQGLGGPERRPEPKRKETKEEMLRKLRDAARGKGVRRTDGQPLSDYAKYKMDNGEPVGATHHRRAAAEARHRERALAKFADAEEAEDRPPAPEEVEEDDEALPADADEASLPPARPKERFPSRIANEPAADEVIVEAPAPEALSPE